MKYKKAANILAIAYTLVLVVMTYVYQMYLLTSLEEVHIMVYDMDYWSTIINKPGGIAILLGSLCSQFFICRYAGPLIMGILYFAIIWSLTRLTINRKANLLICAVATLPCMCAWLCIENTTYLLSGTTALMIVALTLWLYSKVSACLKINLLIPSAIALNIIVYWTAGSAALALSLACVAYECLCSDKSWSRKALSLIYPVVTVLTALAFYYTGQIATLQKALTPALYYDMGTTYFMYLYALVAIFVFIVSIACTKSTKQKIKVQIYASLACFAAFTALMMCLYGSVHSKTGYENHQQRYYARHEMWDEIINMPYDGSATPYTSYRFLALAHKGMLADHVREYNPHIGYLFENKPLVKKRDQQVYSDIWYDCDYMAAARHSAFDTDIVTPGYFNPTETQKLAVINIATKDYGVAEKMLTKLQKTLFYRKWADEYMQYLYNDSLAASNPLLAAKIMALPSDNQYLSPKGIERDLSSIVSKNPDQKVVEEFLRAFLILTNQLP